MENNLKKSSTTEAVSEIGNADIVITGGGPGGFSAAVAAARQGASVILVERYGQLGGMANIGEVQPFMFNHAHGFTLDGPLYVEWIKAMRKYYPPHLLGFAFDDRLKDRNELNINKCCAALAAEDLCLEAGVKILYHHTLVDATVQNRAIESITVHSKSGFGVIRGKIFIDSTGDGDLAALAGCRFEIGNDTGKCQPMTTCFKVSNVDLGRMPTRYEMDVIYNNAKRNGTLDCPRENLLYFFTMDNGIVHFNTTRVINKNPVNGIELSEAEIESRRQIRNILHFLQNNVPGFEEAQLLSMAAQIGVRESRRIIGRKYLTQEAFENAEKQPDAIARVSYPIDIHNPSGSGTIIKHLPANDWYEIPYGCIVPTDSENLVIGSRCISVDHAIHSSIRVMPPVCTIGQAAGVAAAIAAQKQISPAEIDGKMLREELIRFGAKF